MDPKRRDLLPIILTGITKPLHYHVLSQILISRFKHKSVDRHLEDIGTDGGGDRLGSVEVLPGDDGEIGDDRLRIEGELRQRRLILRHELLLLLLLLLKRLPSSHGIIPLVPLRRSWPRGPRRRRRCMGAAPLRRCRRRERAVPIVGGCGGVGGQPRLLEIGSSGAIHGGGSVGTLHLHRPQEF